MKTVAWFSAGVSSGIACYLKRKEINEIYYIDITDQHPDSMRFVKDFEKVLEIPIKILSSQYKSVNNVCMATQFVNSAHGASCTRILKKRVRKEWEQTQTEKLRYIWGLDKNETDRAENIIDGMPEFEHCFPLIEACLSKKEVHGLCQKLNVKRPVMYDMGYSNNNCIGCVKGGMGYWNKIRKDFPEVFKQRAEMERKIGHSIIKGIFLDELPPDRGRMQNEILPDCGIACELSLN